MALFNNKHEILNAMSPDGSISGKVTVSVTDILEMNSLEFLDYLSEELIGSTEMDDVDFEVVGVNDGLVVLSVTGSVVRLLDATVAD